MDWILFFKKKERIILVQRNEEFLSPDKPISNPKDDLFGYSHLAMNLANSISRMSPPQGLVFSITGPWGSGKTTMLNFIKFYLKTSNGDNKKVIISDFNPWWFSGQENLTRNFFIQLFKIIQKWEMKGKEIGKKVGEFIDYLYEGEVIKDSKWSILLNKYSKKGKEITKLKKEIEEILRKQDNRILIVIDDIDRLTADEIKKIFRLIKSICDFPNIIYVLAFDKNVVVNSLSDVQGISGEDYLEKIVQVPFTLPLPNKDSLQKMLFNKLNSILEGTPNHLFDISDWANVYHDGIKYFINTPRDITRFTNSLSVTYNTLKKEINAVDFIAIESLRIFFPNVYTLVSKNIDFFAGSNEDQYGRYDNDSLKEFHTQWLEKLEPEERKHVKKLIIRLFPKLESLERNVNFPSSWLTNWRRELRVCSPDIFPIYFAFSIPENIITNSELISILSLVDDTQKFMRKLKELSTIKLSDGSTKIRLLLDQLEDYVEEKIQLDSIPKIIDTFFEIGDELIIPEDEVYEFMYPIGNDMRIIRIVSRLLKRLDENSRFDLLKSNYKKTDSISILVMLYIVIAQQHGKFGVPDERPEHERLINLEFSEKLGEILLKRIRNFCSSGNLLETPKIKDVIHTWKNLAGNEEVKEWILTVLKEDKGFIRLIEASISSNFSFLATNVLPSIKYKPDFRWLEPFISVHEIIQDIKKYVENDEKPEIQRKILKSILEDYKVSL